MLFKKREGWGLISRFCAHRGVDLSYGRLEEAASAACTTAGSTTRDGRCVEQPAEPDHSQFLGKIRISNYPCVEKNGIIFAYMGAGDPPPFPHYDCFVAPDEYTFAFKGLWECNWLQGLEGGIDPSHVSFLHRFIQEDPREMYGQQFAEEVEGTGQEALDARRRELPPRHRGRERRSRSARLRAPPADRGHQARPRHQPAVPERLRRAVRQHQGVHPVARADRRLQPLLVHDLVRLRRAHRQGHAPAAAAGGRDRCRTTGRCATATTTGASTRTSRRSSPTRAWAWTSTCTTSGPSRAWVRSRTARSSASASRTAPSPPTGACCCGRSTRSPRAVRRPRTRSARRRPRS